MREQPLHKWLMPTADAARILGTTPATIRRWEMAYGFPVSRISPSRRRRFAFGEIVAIREALNEGLSVAAALERAQERVRAYSDGAGSRWPGQGEPGTGTGSV